jgi:putative transposase
MTFAEVDGFCRHHDPYPVRREDHVRACSAKTCLTKDREALLAFYDFPADHWDHPRTGNPIESVFATVRHRTVRTKGALSQKTAKLMVFKLVQAAAKTWRRLKGANQLPLVIDGVTFTDGVAACLGRVTQIPA